jgi:hypothetical protein
MLFALFFAVSSFISPQIHASKVRLHYIDPAPFILPPTDPVAIKLNQIFSSPHVIKNEKEFKKAGFELLFNRMRSNKMNRARCFLKVARHPALPGYLFKLYLQEEACSEMPSLQRRLIQRCKSASMVRNRIQKDNLRYFTVPNKWLYAVPKTKLFVLVVQDMQLETRDESKRAWKRQITTSHLKELYRLCSDGYISIALDQNVAYTKLGNFSCIDTEFPKRVLDLRKVKRHLSRKMSAAWDRICSQHQKK